MSACRARWRRIFTAFSVMPNIAATSAVSSSSMSRKMTMARTGSVTVRYRRGRALGFLCFVARLRQSPAAGPRFRMVTVLSKSRQQWFEAYLGVTVGGAQFH